MKLLLVASAPVSAIEEKGNVDTIEKIHNPNDIFEEIHLLEPFSEQRGIERLGESIVVHHTYVPFNGGVLGKLLRGLSLFVAVVKGSHIVNDEEIDVIRGQKPFIGGFIGVLIQWLTGVPSITSLHNDYDKRQQLTGNYDVFGFKYLTEAIERLAISKAAYTFVLTSYLREYAIRHGASSDDIFVLPNHIDPASFRASADSAGEIPHEEVFNGEGRIVIFVGRLEEQKDPMTLLRGFERVKAEHPDLSLFFIGDGSLRPELETYRDDAELEDVYITGFIDRAKVGKCMSLSDVFVLPTGLEGMGFVFIEAQAMDLPIVTTDIPHTKIVVHEDNSLQFEPGDDEMLGEQITTALDDTMRNELIDQGKRALRRLSTDRQHDRVEAAFRDIIDRDG